MDVRGFTAKTGHSFLGSPGFNWQWFITGNLTTAEKGTDHTVTLCRWPRVICATKCLTSSGTKFKLGFADCERRLIAMRTEHATSYATRRLQGSHARRSLHQVTERFGALKHQETSPLQAHQRLNALLYTNINEF